MSSGTLLGMGELLRSRVLRALGLGGLWVQLEALSTRLKRVEVQLGLLAGEARPPERPQTLRAAPPPPASGPADPDGVPIATSLPDFLAAHRRGGK